MTHRGWPSQTAHVPGMSTEDVIATACQVRDNGSDWSGLLTRMPGEVEGWKVIAAEQCWTDPVAEANKWLSERFFASYEGLLARPWIELGFNPETARELRRGYATAEQMLPYQKTTATCFQVGFAHRGVSPENAQRWWDAGASPEAMEMFVRNGFDSDEFRAWSEVGMGYGDMAVEWRDAGFTPAEYKRWITNRCLCDRAVAWRDAGYAPDAAGSWVSAGVKMPDGAKLWIDAGFDEDGAFDWTDAGVDDPAVAAAYRDAGFSGDQIWSAGRVDRLPKGGAR